MSGWMTTPAVANALVKDGVVRSYEIVSGGAGYSSAPTVSIPNTKGFASKIPMPKVEIAFGRDLKTKGAVSAITLAK